MMIDFFPKIPTEFDTSTFHALGQPISKLPTPPYSGLIGLLGKYPNPDRSY